MRQRTLRSVQSGIRRCAEGTSTDAGATPIHDAAYKLLYSHRHMVAVLAGPEHAELRTVFAQWLRRSWDEDYDLEAGADETLRGELDRLVAAGEMEAMGSLTAERWKERQRQKEAQIRARAMAEGRAEGLEFERRLLGSQAARRFGTGTGKRLSALLAGESEPERLAAVGDAIIDCGTGAELLAAAQRIVGVAN